MWSTSSASYEKTLLDSITRRSLNSAVTELSTKRVLISRV